MQNNKNMQNAPIIKARLSADPQAVLNAFGMSIFNRLHLFYFTVKTNRDEH